MHKHTHSRYWSICTSLDHVFVLLLFFSSTHPLLTRFFSKERFYSLYSVLIVLFDHFKWCLVLITKESRLMSTFLLFLTVTFQPFFSIFKLKWLDSNSLFFIETDASNVQSAILIWKEKAKIVDSLLPQEYIPNTHTLKHETHINMKHWIEFELVVRNNFTRNTWPSFKGHVRR